MHELSKDMISVKARDGHRSRIAVFTGNSDSDAPVVVCMPAMGVAADYYEPLAVTGVHRGWHVVTADLRGLGESSVRPSRATQFGYHELVRYDWPAVISSVRERFPSNPLFVLGHSLGGQISSLYVAANPGTVHGLILIATCSVWFRGWDFPRNLGLLVSSQAIRAVAEVLGYFPGNRLGFAGKESKRLIQDWSRQAATGKYKVGGSDRDFEQLLRTVTIPVLAVSFHGDFFAPERAVLNLSDKMPLAEKTHWHLKGSDLDTHELDHFKWVKNSEPLVARIDEWIQGAIHRR